MDFFYFRLIKSIEKLAEQKGLFRFSGKLGNTVGYTRGKKYVQRSKPASYQASEESIKSSLEFGYGSKACVLLKEAFKPLLLKSFKGTLHNRLAEVLRAVIRSGPLAIKGKRKIFDGDVSRLKAFEFNANIPFHKLCSKLPQVSLSATEVYLKLDTIVWQEHIQAPASATQVKIGLVCSFVNFNDDSYNSILVGAIKIKSGETLKGASLSIPIPQEEEMAMIIVANIYFESTNYGAEYIMGGKKFEAARIIEAVHFKDGKPYVFIQEDIPNPVKLIDQVKPDVFWDIEE
ncbi:hypothetical protein FYC62_14320 [Pedobacter aquae]|uniref:Uncharacterized protein n=1 Tax=Pedobacter aquae TaxID=2605747 RepID=A0A5C0VJ22_9SPHI|nr:hypothetical protein [Pedobacter aquae]QEK52705.1 hypothetical protein FYC62_14320 [Pedobacter aquae]